MRRALAVVAMMALVADTAAAQPAGRSGRARGEAAPRPDTERRFVQNEDANQTQRDFQQLLQQYPPSLATVFRLDPSLLTDPAYLGPYPALAEYLAQHPEIAHNPAFFLGVGNFGWDGRVRNDSAAAFAVRDIFEGLFVLLGVLGVVSTIGWLLRTLSEHRRWLRVSKVQTEAHAKLLDRMTSNQDLLAYVQSPAGQRFLEGAPISVSAVSRPLAAPVSRILWSLQAGAVVGFGGAGLLYVSRRLSAEALAYGIDIPLFIAGALAVAVGVGFIASAALAFGISHRLGLLARPQAAFDPETGTAR